MIRVAVVAVALAAAGCSLDHVSDELACSSPDDCEGNRTCVDGYCVEGGPPVQCPASCGSCVMATMSCTLSGDATPNGNVTCPSGWNCTITCGAGACRNVDCREAASCVVTCTGDQACDSVRCGNGPCDVTCTGADACTDVDCRDSCACDVTCSDAQACASPAQCPGNPCETGDGCTSAPGSCTQC
jgi:hypothetical protein